MDATVLDAQGIREALERVLASSGFRRNERQSAFLRCLVERHLEGRASELKESVLAIDVFGRRPDYDPKIDAIVRTEAVRLRARLQQYYAGPGSTDPVVIDLPKGGYRPSFRERPAPRPPLSIARFSSWPGWVAASLALVISLGAFWSWRRADVAPLRLAVLPLETEGYEGDNSYLADGLTDELINSLSVLDGLTVRSRTSSFALKGKHLSLAEVGQQLQVDVVVEGSVQQAGSGLRVNAEVIRVGEDRPLWSGRFDRTLTDILAIQEEISQGIVNALRLKLDAGRQHYETNLEAYDLYLRGRHGMAGFPSVGRNIAIQAIHNFQAAIDLDSRYAIAYAGMADALLAIDENVTNPEAYRRAAIAASRAVEIDPNLSDAQSAAASIQAREYDWPAAERGFRRAIALNPNNALAHLKLGFLVLIMQERFADGLVEVRRAAALDPLSPYVSTELGRALLWASQFDEAVTQLRKAVALDPSRDRAYNALERALALDGKLTEARAVFDDGIKHGAVLSDGPEAEHPCEAGLAGRRDEALASLQRWEAVVESGRPSGPARPVPADPLERDLRAAMRGDSAARLVAQAFACVRDEDRAVRYLEQAIAQHEPGVVELVQSPEFAWLKRSPRLVGLRQRLHLPV